MAKVLTNLVFKNSTPILDEEADFPGSPEVGQFCFKGGVLYIYAIIDTMETWYPLTNQNQHYIFNQAITADTWIITHNLGSDDLIFVCYDENGTQMSPSNISFDSDDQITLSWVESVKGKAVVFAASERFIPSVQTASLEVGNDITMSGTSIVVGGTDIVALLDLTQSDLNAMFSWNDSLGEITFKGDLIPENNDSLSIGSSTKKIKDLHISANTIYVGDNATFEGTSLAINAGPSPTSLAETPTVQAASLVLEPFTYNPGAGDVSLEPSLKFKNLGGQQYGISFNLSQNQFQFDSPNGVGTGSIKSENITVTDTLTVGTVRTTGSTQVQFDQDFRVDGDVILGYDQDNDVTIKGSVDLQTPITFGEGATLGDGNDNIAINCGEANQFTVVADNVDINGAGKITAAEMESSGNLTVQGDLFVNGTQTVVNTTTLEVTDNEVIVNNGEAGAGITAGTGGLRIDRGSLPDAILQFDDSNDSWKVGVDGSLSQLSVSGHDHDGRYLRANANAMPAADNVHDLGASNMRFADAYAVNFRGALVGNASTATQLQTARTIGLSGDVTGSASFDGSAGATITATVTNDSHTHDGRYYTESEQDAKFLVRNASSVPDTDLSFDLGDGTHRWNNVYAQSFKGQADTAAKWTTARTVTFSGDVSGNFSIDGSGNVTCDTTVGGGSGINAVTLNNLNSEQFLRSDANDTADNLITFAAGLDSDDRILVSTTRDNAGDVTPNPGKWAFEATAGTATIALGQNNGDASIQAFGTGTAYNLYLNPVAGNVYIGSDEIYHEGNVSNFAVLDDYNEFTANSIYANATGVYGKETGGTNRSLIRINGSNNVLVGNTSLPTVIQSNGSLQDSSGNDILTSASTIDADTLSGISLTQFLRSDMEDTMDVGNDASALKIRRSNASNNQVSIAFETDTGTETITRYLGVKAGKLMFAPTADIHATGAFVLTTENEGSGNGLDADLLDGKQGSEYAVLANSNTFTGANIFTGNVSLQSASDPFIQFTDQGASADDQVRRLYIYENGLLFRELNDDFSTKNDVFRVSDTQLEYMGNDIWHENNDGPGSGLNADLLDGVQGSNFARTDVADDFSGLMRHFAGLQSFDSAETPNKWVKFGRSSNQFVTMYGNSGGNFIEAYAYDTNPKHFAIRVTSDSTSESFQFQNDGDFVVPSDVQVGDDIIVSGDIIANNVRSASGQQLVLDAGESYDKVSGQTNEYVYVNAEQGLSVNTPNAGYGNWDIGYSVEETVIKGSGITINGNDVWHEGNDGSGSGLDADTVDGAQLSTDGTAASNSDTKIMSEKAVVAYVAANGGGTYDDNDELNLGDSDDLTLVHDGTDSFINNATGNLQLQVNDGEDAVVAVPNGKVSLYYDNSEKAYTRSDGFEVDGKLYATLGDLAEVLTCQDEEVPIGTVMKLDELNGHDVEVCDKEKAVNVTGVVSANPGMVLNSKETGIPVAYAGKVPVRVIGPIKKGWPVVPAGNGLARAMEEDIELLYSFGGSIEENLDDGEKLVMCIIK